MTEYKKAPLSLITGGLSESATTSKKAFVSAYVTDTRLMGVIGVYIHWKLIENMTYTELHQFFYFDAEEYGFDTYKSVLTKDLGLQNDEDGEKALKELREAENTLLGGLGGKQVNLSELEARYLVQEYVDLNQRMELPLPEGYNEYKFLLKPQITLDRTEEYVLMSKQCPILNSPYQIINYFLMRCFAKDFGAAKFLTKNYVRTNIFPEHKAATLYKNTIDPSDQKNSGSNTDYYCTDSDTDFGTFQTHTAYLCESLIEYDDQYFLVVTQVTLDHLRIVKFEKVSSFKISAAEAAMMLTRPEYITVFDIFKDAPLFTHNSTELAKRSMVTLHDKGSLFMIFHPHNNHVNGRVFRLNEDVLGIYYVSDSGQIILSSYTAEGIRALEGDFLVSGYARHTVLVAKYQFKEPVLYDFITSDFEDFEDFVEFIATDTFQSKDPEY
ncbi:MAG: hypothetical protein HFE73_03630 [Firmicutes bacterium]|nr:hypothetical protein [Bacillota bacterium]